MHDPPHGAAAVATRAGLAFAPVDLEPVLEIAELAVGRDVVAQRRTAGFDRRRQGFPDRPGQPAGARGAHIGGEAAGRDPGFEQALADIDIAEPGDDPLVQERRLDRGAPAFKQRPQPLPVEIRAGRLGPEMRDQRVVGELALGHPVHHAEPPGIGEADECPVAENERDVLVVRERVGRLCVRPVLVDDHTARHAEMGQQHSAVVEADRQIFRPPSHRRHGPADQPFLEIGRQRAPQIAARDAHAVDAPPLHRAREAAADGFDLGKFGHAAN